MIVSKTSRNLRQPSFQALLVSGGLCVTTSSDNLAPDRSWGNMVSIGSMMRTGALMNHSEDVLMYSFIKFSLQSIWADRAGKVYRSSGWLAGGGPRPPAARNRKLVRRMEHLYLQCQQRLQARQTCQRWCTMLGTGIT